MKLILLLVLISTFACRSIGDYTARKDTGCPNCQKFEDKGYQRVRIVTNYDKLSPDEFRAYVNKVASFFAYTQIKYFWSKMLGGELVLREAVVYLK